MDADEGPTPIPESPLEPEKYFKAEGRQWWSAKQGEWIDPTQEIKMDGMKPKDVEDGEEIGRARKRRFMEGRSEVFDNQFGKGSNEVITSCKKGKFPLTPMGVLAPGSAHARPSAQPPIDVSGNFRHLCLQTHLQRSHFSEEVMLKKLL